MSSLVYHDELMSNNDELDILLNEALKEIDELDQKKKTTREDDFFESHLELLNKEFPISPESLSPASSFEESQQGQAQPHLLVSQEAQQLEQLLQQKQQAQENHDMTTLLKFFSNLKTNYLKLCNSYNFLLLKLSDCEMDRCKLYEENLELKKLLKYMIDVNNSDPSRKKIWIRRSYFCLRLVYHSLIKALK